MLDEFVARNALSLQDLKQEFGIEPQPFPEDFWKELHQDALEYYAEERLRDEDFDRVMESYNTFKKQTYEWLRISEKAVFDYRDMVGE